MLVPLSLDTLIRHHVLVAGDSPFQQRARLLQARWREQQELPIGAHRGAPLGSRLAMPEAQTELRNYLSPTVRDVVRSEVEGPKGAGKLYGKPRIYNDLLSSQPLCFNLFAELQRDLDCASRSLLPLAGLTDAYVTRIQFEHSPGRGDPRFTNDRSAFDVFVEYQRGPGKRGFLGIEVKYHEDLKNPAAGHRQRYDEIAQAFGCFRSDALDLLKSKPLQQIWRDHLLACSMLIGKTPLYDEGRFVFLHPALNERCANAVKDYQACLVEDSSFQVWTLESAVEAIAAEGAGQWIELFRERYMSFETLA